MKQQSYARVNWKGLQTNPVKRSKDNHWTWQKPRTRSKVVFTPNPRTSVKPQVVIVNKNTAKSPAARNGCTVNALAVAGQVPFFQAEIALRNAGRKDGKGFSIDRAVAKGSIKGFRFVRVTRGRQTLGQFLQKHPVGRFIAWTRDHAFAVVHGKVADWNYGLESQRSIVQAAYIVKADTRD